MLRNLAAVLPVLLVSTGLTAQTQTSISPKDGATQGNRNNSIPYSWWPARYQQIFNHDSFSHGTGPLVIKGLRYRMNRSFANGRWGGHRVTLSMWFGLAAKGVTASSFKRTFDQNIDQPTKKLVINRKTFLFPKLNNQNFDIKIPMDAAFIYVPAGKRALVQEVWSLANTNNNQIFTYPIDSWSGQAPVQASRVYAYDVAQGGGTSVRNGSYAGCPNSNNRTATLSTSFRQLKPGGNLTMTGRAWLGRQTAAILILGATPLNVTLPPTQCKLMNDIILLMTGPTQGTSNLVTFRLTIPNNPKLVNAKFLSQAWFVDSRANALGVFSSYGLINTIGDGKVKGPDKFKSATGTSTGFGLITQFHN